MSWWYKLLHRHLGIFSFCNDEWKAEVEIWHRRRASSRSLLPSLTFVFHSQLRNHSKYCLQNDAIDHVAIQASPDYLLCEPYTYIIFAERSGDLPTATTGPPPLTQHQWTTIRARNHVHSTAVRSYRLVPHRLRHLLYLPRADTLAHCIHLWQP